MNDTGDTIPVPFDLRGYVDDERARLRHSFTCQGCGSPDPARINTKSHTCSDCELVIEDHGGYVVTADRGDD